jgi:hypothetical protein
MVKLPYTRQRLLEICPWWNIWSINRVWWTLFGIIKAILPRIVPNEVASIRKWRFGCDDMHLLFDYKPCNEWNY